YDADGTRTAQVKLLIDKVDERLRLMPAQLTDLETTIEELSEIRNLADEGLRAGGEGRGEGPGLAGLRVEPEDDEMGASPLPAGSGRGCCWIPGINPGMTGLGVAMQCPINCAVIPGLVPGIQCSASPGARCRT